ncbi:uncharacterized protein LOC119330930 isoform X1 [Triticum dicoccoides]|uniref:uncharacterized protein LOC119330930 isoform X1 n=1 Tax=Triticum dicoccoides TaxID=85692 RepID=UPI001891C87D|nr:uncharacterized protein LOC119330930 isoform X1 [Triticum dicoccoides]XP_044424855.1 uncharacterized protein LOC123149285 isoform X2 [Triticum aestivum]
MRTLEGEGSAAAFHGRRLLVAAGGTSRRAATSSFSHVPGHERHKGLRSRGRCQGRGAGDSQADAYHQQPLRPRATSRCWCPASICSPRSLPHVRYCAQVYGEDTNLGVQLLACMCKEFRTCSAADEANADDD